MGILDSKKLEEVKKTIRSHSAKDLQDWIDSYYERIALAEQEESLFPSVIKPRMAAVGKLNGTSHSEAKSKGVSVKKTPRVRKATAKA